ncbi:MAG: restriction endonuclease subunit S [Arcobacteraceae bacterium]
MVKKVKLKEIVDLQNGYAFKSDNYINFSNTMICRMSNIKPDIGFDINYNPKYIADDSSDLYKNYLLKDNDIIIAMTDLANDPKILGVPVLVKTNEKIILQNQRVGKLIIKSKEVDSSYLMRVLSTKKARNFYKRFSNGGLQINIGKKEILENIIPLPPLAEQKQIAKTLDKVTEIITLRKESITKLDALAKSIFIDMFGDPVENPMNWDITTMKDLNVMLEGGKNIAKSSNDKNIKNYILKISSVTSGEFNSNEIKPLPNDYNVPKSHFIKQGDLLMSRANTSLLVGSTAYIKESYDNLVLPDKIWRFVFPEDIKLNKIFYCKLAQTKSIRNEISNRATGTSGSMKNISKPKALSIPIIYPPINLQNKFAKIIEKIEEQKTLYTQELEKLQNNFDALLQKSFQE